MYIIYTKMCKKKRSRIKTAVSSMCAAAAQVAVGHPFDTVKACLQNQKIINPYSASFLYRGWRYPMISASFNCLISFAVFKEVREYTKSPENPSGNTVLSGLTAGLAVTPTVFIFDGCKIMRQVGKFAAPINMLGRRGVFSTACRESVGLSAYFCSYAFAREELEKGPLFSGAFAGFCNWTLSYPIDVIKSRQIAGNISALEAAKMGQMWTGYPVCILRGVIVNSAIFSAYEYSGMFLNKYIT